MKILFLVNHDVASFYALKLLLPHLASKHALWVWRSSQVGGVSKRNIPQALLQLKEYEKNSLVSERYTDDKTSHIDTSFIDQYLERPTRIENNINDPSIIDELKKLGIELIVCIRYGKILKENIINLPAHGVINLHSGILPNYRGVMATFWSMLNQESEIGTTLHFIDDASIDTGAIIKISKQTLDREACYLANVINLYRDGCNDILQTVNSIAQGEKIDTLPAQGKGRYYTFPDQKDILSFQQKDLQLVNSEWFSQFSRNFELM